LLVLNLLFFVFIFGLSALGLGGLGLGKSLGDSIGVVHGNVNVEDEGQEDAAEAKEGEDTPLTLIIEKKKRVKRELTNEREGQRTK
jgi:hypothetical protein